MTSPKKRKKGSRSVPSKPPPRTKRPKEKSPLVERVLALDLSSVCVGWSIFDEGGPSGHGKYQQKGKGHGEKLTKFSAWLQKMLDEARPDIVVVEKPYPSRNRNAYRALTLYIGKVIELHWQYFGEELSDESQVSSHTVKAALRFPKGQNHEDNKRIAVGCINDLYDLTLRYKKNDRAKDISDDDVADAIALNRAWHLKYRATVMEDE